jgi:5-methylcytosine-specific restriction endonuclease McrA
LRRKLWLLQEFGNGVVAACAFGCGVLVDLDTITVDRIIPKKYGGTYKRDNIRPACAKCNSSDGARLARENT